MDNEIKSAKELQLLAEHDLFNAQKTQGSKKYRANLCQQAAEKYLKGSLVSLGEQPPHIHDLESICSLIEKHRSSFSKISSYCEKLSQYAVTPRYNLFVGSEVSNKDLHIALQSIKDIRALVEEEFPELFQDMKNVDNLVTYMKFVNEVSMLPEIVELAKKVANNNRATPLKIYQLLTKQQSNTENWFSTECDYTISELITMDGQKELRVGEKYLITKNAENNAFTVRYCLGNKQIISSTAEELIDAYDMAKEYDMDINFRRALAELFSRDDG